MLDLVHEETHPVVPNASIQARCIDCLLIQQVSSIDHSIQKTAWLYLWCTGFPTFQTVTHSTFRVFIQHKQFKNSNTR